MVLVFLLWREQSYGQLNKKDHLNSISVSLVKSGKIPEISNIFDKELIDVQKDQEKIAKDEDH